MNPSRRLRLQKQALSDLTPDELADLVGAADVQLTPQCASTPLKPCTGTLPIVQCLSLLTTCNVETS